MNSVKYLYLLFSIISFGNLNAQEVWSLQKCVEYAQENNLTIKQSRLLIEQAKLNEQLGKYSRYPSLNASSTFGYQFGRTIDPTTNGFITEGIGGQTLNLDAGLSLYNGGRINKNIKQSKLNREAAEADLLQSANDITLVIATTYLNVLFAKEQLTASKQRLDLTFEQKKQTQKLITAGAIPANDVLDVDAQIARNEQDLVAQENSLAVSLLNLKQLLQLAPDFKLDVEVPNISWDENADIEALTMAGIYDQAVFTQPFIKAGELRLKSAEMQVDIARADLMPSLTLFGGIDSRYSTKSPQFSESDFELGSPIPVVINGNAGSIQTFGPVQNGEVSYFEQIGDNLGQSIGLNIRVPIFNNHRAKLAMEQAKINISNTLIQNEQAKQQLKTDIQGAITNAKASRKQMEASSRTVNATKAAYENALKKFELGAINTFELSSAKNQFDNAEVQSIVAKYDYIFKLKVVDFYRGKQITLN